MKISFSHGVGRKIIAYTLVGTMATSVGVAMEERVSNDPDKRIVSSDLANGYYYDEDVKKNKQDIMDRIALGGGAKVKTYGKVKNISAVPKKMVR